MIAGESTKRKRYAPGGLANGLESAILVEAEQTAFNPLTKSIALLMKIAHMIAFILLAIGGLNWGLVGLGWLVGGGADWNVVHMIIGSLGTQVEGLVYVLVGISAVWIFIGHKKDCKVCSM